MSVFIPSSSGKKLNAQVKREETHLRCIQLCEHNLRGRCDPKGGHVCNFAHWLRDLRAPNEGEGDWWKTWGKGDVDIRFWATYTPNLASVHPSVTAAVLLGEMETP